MRKDEGCMFIQPADSAFHWLMRLYGFAHEEIVAPDGMLSLDVDPKLA